MTKLMVRREKVVWQDRGRSYRVLVDGKVVAQVANGEEVPVPVVSGKHIVQLKIDWCQSEPLEVNVEAGETQVLACGPNSTPLLALLYITFFRRRYIWLRRIKPIA